MQPSSAAGPETTGPGAVALLHRREFSPDPVKPPLCSGRRDSQAPVRSLSLQRLAGASDAYSTLPACSQETVILCGLRHKVVLPGEGSPEFKSSR